VSLAKIKLKKLEPAVEITIEEPKVVEETVTKEEPVVEEPKAVEATVKTEEEKETASEPENKVTLKKKEGDSCPDGKIQTFKGCEDIAKAESDQSEAKASAEARAKADALAAVKSPMQAEEAAAKAQAEATAKASKTSTQNTNSRSRNKAGVLRSSWDRPASGWGNFVAP